MPRGVVVDWGPNALIVPPTFTATTTVPTETDMFFPA